MINENTFQLTYITRNTIRDLLKNKKDRIFDNIERIMEANNISQEQLADAICSEQQHISKILRKRSDGITINVMIRIAHALNTPIADLAK